ncbi:MAG: aminopeptidase P family protein [Candidatus Omnitrophota bacterium]|nr:MAG: aminopeptidase P family protein [Candidatus Omnitrophota bacterium]
MKRNTLRCIREIKRRKLDSLLISSAANVTYLTGFREAEGYLLVTREGQMVYFTNFLYAKEAQQYPAWKVAVSNNNIFNMVKIYIKKLKLKKVGFEAKLLPFLEYEKIKDSLTPQGVDFIKTIDLIEDLRAVKNRSEISLIKESVKISEQAFEFIREIYDDTMTEKGLSIEIERFLRLKGDNRVAFAPIVAGGKNSALPHYQPAEVRLDKKFFLIDLGSKYCGYCADLTRVFFWGKMPILFRKIYDIVKGASCAAISKVKAGIPAKEVDKAARQFIDKKGYGRYFGHGLGHGIGLSVHERPYLTPRNEDVLGEGMVLTIEPAIYIYNKFGIRIEDMVLVKQGKAEVLSGHANW